MNVSFSVGIWRWTPGGSGEAGSGSLEIEGEVQTMAGTAGLVGRMTPNCPVIVAWIGRSALVLGTGGYSAPGAGGA